MQLKGHRVDKYKYPKLAMSWPYGRWTNNKKFFEIGEKKMHQKLVELSGDELMKRILLTVLLH